MQEGIIGRAVGRGIGEAEDYTKIQSVETVKSINEQTEQLYKGIQNLQSQIETLYSKISYIKKEYLDSIAEGERITVNFEGVKFRAIFVDSNSDNFRCILMSKTMQEGVLVLRFLNFEHLGWY